MTQTEKELIKLIRSAEDPAKSIVAAIKIIDEYAKKCEHKKQNL